MTFRIRGDALGPVVSMTLCVRPGLKRYPCSEAADTSGDTIGLALDLFKISIP